MFVSKYVLQTVCCPREHSDSPKRIQVRTKQSSNYQQSARSNRLRRLWEALIKPAFLRAESDHGVSPAGFLSVAEKDAE
jgi:hypothetical protein